MKEKAQGTQAPCPQEAMSDLPIVRTALNARNETDTFFAPTDAAIESFTRWWE
jgi:hypothetical protein